MIALPQVLNSRARWWIVACFGPNGNQTGSSISSRTNSLLVLAISKTVPSDAPLVHQPFCLGAKADGEGIPALSSTQCHGCWLLHLFLFSLRSPSSSVPPCPRPVRVQAIPLVVRRPPLLNHTLKKAPIAAADASTHCIIIVEARKRR